MTCQLLEVTALQQHIAFSGGGLYPPHLPEDSEPCVRFVMVVPVPMCIIHHNMTPFTVYY